ncbi:MAG: metallophosphoesterase [Acholeplasmataceae bacterium]|nr:metallophosphoesterase [Acholeplasmataceae bacterium]
MNKHTIILVIPLILITCMLFLSACGQTDDESPQGEETVLEFLAVADVHLKSYDSIERDRFQAAITLGYTLTDHLDAVVVNGDFTDGGHDPQYAAFKEITDATMQEDTALIVNHGNHENGRNESDPHEYFREFFGYSVDHVFEVNGYTFISVGVHPGDQYTENQAKWMDSKLSKLTEDDPLRPVFVLIHYPNYQTVFNSDKNGRTTFDPVLEKYPQSIVISGHSHPPIQDPRIIHQDKFTSFNNTAMTYFYYEKADFRGPEDTISGGHFAIFKVNEQHQVTIERYVMDDTDLLGKTVKLDLDYVIDVSQGTKGFTYHKGWHDDFTNPAFDSDAGISLARREHAWTISFDQAKGSQMVYYYIIEIINEDTLMTQEIIKVHASFHLADPPNIITRSLLNDLEFNTTYLVSITAVNVSNRQSEPLVKTITTS